MSLKYRIAVVIFLLEAVMMSIVFYTTVSRSQEINQNQLEINERVILDLLGDLSRLALFTFEYDNLQAYIEKIAEALGITREEAMEKMAEMEYEQNVQHMFDSSETHNIN